METPFQQLDLNCDLGEGEPRECTASFMALINSANIACGGHAGDDDSMRYCLELSRVCHVRVGAHPGPSTHGGFGRSLSTLPAAPALLAELNLQVGRLQGFAQAAGVALRHIKLHGAWYHATESDPGLADAYVDWVAQAPRPLILFALAGGRVADRARFQGLEVWEEGFLDRGYLDDGGLVPRGEPGALVTDPEEVRVRLEDLQRSGGWRSIHGAWLRLNPKTLCVHCDTSGAESFLRLARAVLTRNRKPPPSDKTA